MKQFIAFVKKEFYHIFRDRRTMLILLGMPVVEIILFGFAISTEVKNVRLAVLDPSNDVVTRKIIDRLDASEYLALEQSGETLNEYQQALLLDDYWMMRGLDYSEVILTEKDREYIRPYVEATLNSLADRYTFTAEEEKKFEDSLRNNYGYPRYEDCEEYIKKHNE